MSEKTRVKPLMKSSCFRFTKRSSTAPEKGKVDQRAKYGKGELIHSTYKITLIMR